MRFDIAELFAFCDLHASRVSGGFLRPDPSITGPGPYYYDRQGFPIPWRDDGDRWIDSTLVWAQMKENRDYSCVGWDEFPDGSYLSTTWLGLDHNVFGRPLFFETMYFSGDIETAVLPFGGGEQSFHPSLEFPDPLGEQGEMTTQCRYGSEEEALAMHHEIARRIRKRWEV